MIKLWKSRDRGVTEIDWLHSKHSFSFGSYYDPHNSNFHNLRVINEDIVQPAKGFATHAHNNMEILTYVLSGELAHRDSLGNGSVIKTGEFQLMSAGSGIAHSEFNHSANDKVHFLQIWFFPEKRDITPRYQQIMIKEKDKIDKFCLIASNLENKGSMQINQRLKIFNAKIAAGKSLIYNSNPAHKIWVQSVKGQFLLNDILIETGDGGGITDNRELKFTSQSDSEMLVFDME